MKPEDAKVGTIVKIVGSKKSTSAKSILFGRQATIVRIDANNTPWPLKIDLTSTNTFVYHWNWSYDELEFVQKAGVIYTQPQFYSPGLWPTPLREEKTPTPFAAPTCEHDFITSFLTGKPWCRKCGETKQ